MNNLNIEFLSILQLSTLLIPNLFNVTLPFILMFGLILAFIKLDKDKELISMFSLGISITEIKKSLYIIIIILLIINITLNLFLSPYIYSKYKKQEYELRNTIDLEKINISNFIELDANLVLDFKKDKKGFKDIFISYIKDGENIIYAKNGNILNKEKKIIFNLIDGYKLNILEENIETLEFQNYKLEFPIKNNNKYNNYDKNAFTILDLIKKKQYINIFEKSLDAITLIVIIIFFYYFLIKENNFQLRRILTYISMTFLILIVQNIIKNLSINSQLIITLNIINIFSIFIIIYFLNYKNKVKN